MKSAVRTRALIAVALAIGAYVGFSSPDSPTAEAAKDTPARKHPQHQLDELHAGSAHDLFLAGHRVADNSSTGALFSAHSWYVAPPPPPAPAPVMSREQLEALQAPKAPPLPFTFMGSYLPDGSNPVFFLTQGDRVYDVRVGDTLDNIYTVDSYTNGQLVMTYKPLNIQQQLAVGGSQ